MKKNYADLLRKYNILKDRTCPPCPLSPSISSVILGESRGGDIDVRSVVNPGMKNRS
jgi:hypothetical protein